MSLNHLSPVNQLSHYLAAITGNYSVTIYLFPSNCKEVACHCRPTFALVICVHIFCLQILSHLKVFCGKNHAHILCRKMCNVWNTGNDSKSTRMNDWIIRCWLPYSVTKLCQLLKSCSSSISLSFINTVCYSHTKLCCFALSRQVGQVLSCATPSIWCLWRHLTILPTSMSGVWNTSHCSLAVRPI